MAEKPIGDEEYKFSEEDAGETFGPGTSKQGAFDKVKRKNILILVFVLVVAFSVYQLLNVFFGSKVIKKKKTAEKPAQVKVIKEELKQEAMPEIEMPPLVEEPVKVVPSAPDLGEKLMPVKTQMQTNIDKIATLESNMVKLEQRLTKQTEQLMRLEQAFKKTAEVINQQQTQLKILLLRHESKIKAAEKDYYITAMVSGRAWLSSKDGRVFSVRVGDKIPGYGRVETIDPKQGMIITNSGDVITHSPDDS